MILNHMVKSWASLEEVVVELGGSKDSPLNSLLSWLSARFQFEQAVGINFFSQKYGQQQSIVMWFAIEPGIIPDEREIGLTIRDFLFKLENPEVDTYHQVTARYLLITVIRSLR